MRQLLHDHVRGAGLIELLLPKKLMQHNFEFTEQKLDSLVVEHMVIRRFAERQSIHAEITRKGAVSVQKQKMMEFWHERWAMLTEQHNCQVHPFHHPVTGKALLTIEKVRLRLKSRGLGRLVCCTVCKQQPAESLSALLDQHLESGIPIMIWPGKDHNIGGKDIKGVVQKSVHDLPHAVHHLQNKYLLKKGTRNLFLIYDNPNQMLTIAIADDELSLLEAFRT
ncbi:MAG: hypothetical protein AAF639_17935 [Chloroflexota bacterium]